MYNFDLTFNVIIFTAVLQKRLDEADDELIQKLKNGELNIEQITKDLEKLYKDELLEYAEKSCPTNEEVNIEIYHSDNEN